MQGETKKKKRKKKKKKTRQRKKKERKKDGQSKTCGLRFFFFAAITKATGRPAARSGCQGGAERPRTHAMHAHTSVFDAAQNKKKKKKKKKRKKERMKAAEQLGWSAGQRCAPGEPGQVNTAAGSQVVRQLGAPREGGRTRDDKLLDRLTMSVGEKILLRLHPAV